MRVKQISDWTLEDRLTAGGPPVVVLFLNLDDPKERALQAEFRTVGQAHPGASFYEVDLVENPSLIGKYSLSKSPMVVLFVGGVEMARHTGHGVATTVGRILAPFAPEGGGSCE